MVGDEADGDTTFVLDFHIRERQMGCIQSTNVDLRKGQIFVDTRGEGAKMNVAMQKLDSLGYIQGCCGFWTDLYIMNRVRHHLETSYYNAEVKSIKDAA